MQKTRYSATFALLRGAVLLIAGAFAILAPATALTFIVVIGGSLLVIDGVLGLASQDYGVDRQWPFWLSLTRGVLSVLIGLLLLLSPYLTQIIPIGALATIVAIPAIVVGIIEIIIIIRDRKSYNPIWAPLGAAALYVLLGLLLLFMPLAGTLLAVQVGGALLAIFAILQLYQTWMAIRETPGVRPASQ
ncbi:MAG TPA: DUF308 domain-containing protein [Devosia sp.]|nr:DUF308 domain-containing protein [Devosia sp.]